jgi:uncharacterized protein YjbI with pentapeptide repeats
MKRFFVVVTIHVLLLALSQSANSGLQLWGVATTACPNGSAFEGRKLTKAELMQVIERSGEQREQVNLCGADLSNMKLEEVDLRNSNLDKANISNTTLFKVNLSGTHLSFSNFHNSQIFNSDFSNSILVAADLRGTEIVTADFRQTNLWQAHFNSAKIGNLVCDGATGRGAVFDDAEIADSSFKASTLTNTSWLRVLSESNSFREADLSESDFSRASINGDDFTKTKMIAVRLDSARFDPMPGALPNKQALASVKVNELIRFPEHGSPQGIIALREAMKDAGRSQEERQLTFAIESQKTQQLFSGNWADKLEGAFRLIMFQWTTRYGLDPGRALRLIGLLILVFSFPYVFAIAISDQPTIWRLWSKERVLRHTGIDTPEPMQYTIPKAILLALHFSAMSAFQIGWRDLNIGTWISNLQPREYRLAATGWTRVISGIQSLCSVYLLAICVLTYFGRPFE